jgi:hypothetical protein
VDSQIYGLYIDTFRAYNCLYTYPQDFYIDPEAKYSDANNKSKEDPLEDITGNYPLVDFELLACRRLQEDLL